MPPKAVKPITLQDRRAEWLYRFDERLGILCEDRPATEREIQIAFQEADRWWHE